MARTAHSPLNNARPQLEELDPRTVPSAAPVIGSIQASTVLVEHDVAHVSADMATIKADIGANASATVMADVTALTTDWAKVRADLAAGVSASTDLKSVEADEATLSADLGASASEVVTVALTQLTHDLSALTTDVGKLDGVVSGALGQVQSDLQALTTTIGASASATVTADLFAISGDMAKVSADLSAGISATADLNAAAAAEAKLSADLGTHVSASVHKSLNTLKHDLKTLSTDVAGVSGMLHRALVSVQAEVNALMAELGTKVSTTVVADIKALNLALAAVSVDLSAGVSASADVSAAISAEATLSADLGTSVSARTTGQLQAISNGLMTIALELGAMAA